MKLDDGENGYSVSHEASTSKNTKEEKEEKKEMKNGKDEEKTKAVVPFYKLFAFADSMDVFLMIFGTIGAIGNGVCMPLMTVIFGDLIDSFGENQNNNKDIVDIVSKVCLKFVYLGLGTLAAAFLEVACWMITGERQAARIRSLYLRTILRQDIAFFDVETNTGEVVGRMSGDTVLIQEAMGEKVGKFIQLISTFIGGFAVAFVKGWLLTLVMLSSIPLLAMAGAAIAIIVSRTSSRGQAAYAKAATVVEQTIGSIRTVASFTGERQAIRNYNEFILSAYKSSVQQGFSTGFGLGVLFLVFFGSYALAIWFGGKMILEKGYTGGAVINVIIAVVTGSMSLGQTSPCLSAFAAGQAASYKMFETIERKPLIDSYDVNGKVLEDVRGDIELKDVYFSYPARPDEQIFTGFSLFISSGTTAALVGQSGSGKSTVISLIERFYDPQAGEVLVDGVNLKDFQLKWIRSKIGLVSQEPVLFSSSIKDNIGYGKEKATMEEIKAAAELANAAKFIDKLPQGFDTMVGEHGTQLSGGQKQRIAIARAILKDPRILLLDEATSALDAESERVVQEALDRVMVNRTTVVVAHRLSTVRNADMIAVIHHGKMVEKGTHSELLKDPEGAYSQLIRLQEINKDQNDSNKSEISSGSFRNSSLRKPSLGRSISRGSSVGNSSRHHSFSILGVPAGLDVGDADQEKATIPREQAPNVSLKRLAALNKPEIPVLLLGTVAAAVQGMIFPIFGILISSVIETFFKPPRELKKDSRFWAMIFLVLGIASVIASPAQTYLFAVAGGKLIRRIRSMCFEKVVHMEVGWFDEPQNSSGAIGARLSADAAMIRALVGDALSLAVQNATSAAAGLIIAFTASWQLALIILVMLPLIGINGYVQVKFLKGFSADAKTKYEEASQVANDAVGSIRTVASFCAEEKVMRMYKKQCEGPIKAGIKQGVISGLGFGVSFFILFSVYATSFYAGARFVEDGKTTMNDVFRVFFALTMAAIGISQSSSFAPDSSKAKVAAASIFGIIDRKSKIDPSHESGTVLENVKGDIELRHISFVYPARPDIHIFRDLCLSIRAGKTVALVGESGSGKSTVISLLQRFYDPDSGHITLDGVELKKLQLRWLRQQMGLVGQEPVLFNDTIRANIAYGKGGANATEAEIVAAAELANAHRFISALQQGYETVVGERGIQLSGGQKQRVAIARAIVKEPKILLLDEATSALDAESERVVQDALDRVMVNRTTVVVAHRLSTIKNANVIAVVKNGVIAEKGTHDSLIHIEGGVYASLVQLHLTASH
ncbi:PREDICTED: ABC transporter B family member 11-like [Tarenaya hassleriana]|uniref:ABC transporter B family member 11-like n=1 Tax=Tarenaya hassleriana TaxID=28532 RepID=UPI00053C5DAB|nr:PREDICTED: ABC transporter B family member 11-like [Tarenaya hassleriana]